MKKIISVLCTASMLLSLTACAGNTKSSTDYSNQTLIGQVTSIDGTKITMQLGELRTQTAKMPEDKDPDGGNTPPDIPEGRQPGSENASPNMADGEKPGGGSTSPNMTDGEKSGGGSTPPDLQEGGRADSGSAPPDIPENNMPDGGGTPPDIPENGEPGNGDNPPELPSEEGTSPSGGDKTAAGFTAGGESVTLDFSGAAVKIESGKEQKDGTLEDITADAILTVEMGDNNTVKTVTVKSKENMGVPGGGFGSSGEVSQGTSANTLDSDGEYSDASYSSTGDDENALRVDGTDVTLTDITVDKSAGASSNTEDGDFYGMNAALLATNGASVTIKNAEITSSAQNGNGVFSYGDGTSVKISGSKITTTADNSGGIQTTGGGITLAKKLTVKTSGNSAAAIRSDRGGGTVQVIGGNYTTDGYNSPAVYSTADITVEDAKLSANNSEALVIEGKNSITLKNCTVRGNMSDTKGTSSDENVHNVMIYQSMSGDADVGTSKFSMEGGTLTSDNGDLFYITNTHCVLSLDGVKLVNKGKEGYLLNVAGNSASRGWGQAGANGGQAEVHAKDQELEGDIVVDTISTLDLTLSGSSVFTGTIDITDNLQGGAVVSDNAAVTVEPGSTWNLTGNCTLTSLENKGTVHFNGYRILLADGTILK